jgi:hypothetical protein
MDQRDNEGAARVLGQPQITRLEHASAGDKQAAIFSVDFGDGAPCAALVMLIAKSQGVRMVELYNHATGEAEAPLRRALTAYTNAVDTIAASGTVAVDGIFAGTVRR